MGRIELILSAFPDARIIYIDRSPVETVPSYISMFTSTWKLLCPVSGRTLYRVAGQTAISIYRHFHQTKHIIPQGQLLELSYSELICCPEKTVQTVYSFLGEPLCDKTYRMMLSSLKEKTYHSKHKYCPENFGYSRKELEAI